MHTKMLEEAFHQCNFNQHSRNSFLEKKKFFQSYDYAIKNANLNRNSQYVEKICIDFYSLVKYFIRFTQNDNGKDHKHVYIVDKNKNIFQQSIVATREKLEARQKNSQFGCLPEQNEKEKYLQTIVSIIEYIQEYLQPNQLMLVFPQTTYYSSTTSLFPITKFVDSLRQFAWKQELDLQQSNIFDEQQWVWCEEMFNRIQEDCLISRKEDKEGSGKIKNIKFIKCPYIDKQIFRLNPCEAQLSYLGKQKFVCLTWNPHFYVNLPYGIYLYGFDIRIIVKIIENRNLQNNLEEKLEEAKQNENQSYQISMKLEQLGEEEDKIEAVLTESQLLLYDYKLIINTYEGDDTKKIINLYFQRVDNLFINVLKNISSKLNFNSSILKQIRQGQYSVASWILQKILIFYILLEMHPVKVEWRDGEVENSLQVQDRIPMLFEKDLQKLSADQTKQILQRYLGKVLFVHKQLQSSINKYIPKEFQKKIKIIGGSQNTYLTSGRFYQKEEDTQTKWIVSTTATEINQTNRQIQLKNVSRKLFTSQKEQKCKVNCKYLLKKVNPSTKVQTRRSDSDIDQQQ